MTESERPMRERAAGAARKALLDTSLTGWGAYLLVADAVLAEIERPSEGMLNAARDWSYAKYGKPIGNDAAIGCLAAMIRAAREGR